VLSEHLLFAPPFSLFAFQKEQEAERRQTRICQLRTGGCGSR